MATEERTSAPVRSALLRGHNRYGRRPGTFGGVHRGVPDRQYGQRFGQVGQLAGRPSASPVNVLDARAAVLVNSPLIHGTRIVGRQAHDRGQARTGWPDVHRYDKTIYYYVDTIYIIE